MRILPCVLDPFQTLCVSLWDVWEAGSVWRSPHSHWPLCRYASLTIGIIFRYLYNEVIAKIHTRDNSCANPTRKAIVSRCQMFLKDYSFPGEVCFMTAEAECCRSALKMYYWILLLGPGIGECYYQHKKSQSGAKPALPFRPTICGEN